MKRVFIPILCLVSIFICSCNANIEDSRGISYYNLENKAFEEKVGNIERFEEWFPIMQSSIQFDTDNNKLIFRQYVTTSYDASRDDKVPPKYKFDKIYVKESRYVFSEDLNHMGLIDERHYKTTWNGKFLEEFTDFNNSVRQVSLDFLNDDFSAIKYNYDTFYTPEYMEKEYIPNYVQQQRDGLFPFTKPEKPFN